MNDPVFDYARLRGKIKEVFGTQDAFADAIGIRSCVCKPEIEQPARVFSAGNVPIG